MIGARFGSCARWLLYVVATLCVAPAAGAMSQDDAPCTTDVLTLTEAADLLRVDADALERLAEDGRVPGRRVSAAWRFSCAALLTWLRGSEAALTPQQLAGLIAKGAQDQAGAPPADPQAAPIGTAPDERTAEDVFLRGQRVLLGRGDVVLDVGQFYARRTELQFAVAGTGPGLATLEQRVLTTVFVGRVGILNETELFASSAFSRLDARLYLGSETLGTSDLSAFGPTSLGFRRTLLRERVGRPDLILTLSGQIPTDDAPAAAGGGLTAVKSVDPVVLFASVNYLRGFPKTASDGTHTSHVDVIDVSMGYGLGLNDTVAISMGVGGQFAGAARVNGVESRQPSIFSVRFGLTRWLAQGLYIEPSVSFGLGGPGDSIAFGVSLPYAF